MSDLEGAWERSTAARSQQPCTGSYGQPRQHLEVFASTCWRRPARRTEG
jgi:hypothetical protein